MQSSATPQPGWYQDPTGPGLRWWDGIRWTEHHQPAVSLPPPPALPGPPPSGPIGPAPLPPPVYQQKWWHIPLLVTLGVLSTVVYIVVQFLS